MCNEANPKTTSLKWTSAFEKELEVVNKRRSDRDNDKRPPTDDSDLVGLAFSGGGIRSATFGLGVLEGLKKYGLLEKIDYLSTVSGGGYIGAWLSANCKRAAERRKDSQQNPPEADWLSHEAEWKESIGHLRRYSNYLSPKVGLFSADTWSMVAIWFRNTLLVQLTVILAIAALLLVPRPLFVVFEGWPKAPDCHWTFALLLMLIGLAGYQLLPLLRRWNWGRGLAFAICSAIAWGINQYLPGEYFPGEYFLDLPQDSPSYFSMRWATILLFLLAVVGIAGNQLRLNWPAKTKPVPEDPWPLSSKHWDTGLACAAFLGLIAFGIGRHCEFRPFAPDKTVIPVSTFIVSAVIAILLVAAGFCLQPVAAKLVNREQVNYTQAWVQYAVVIPMLAVGFLVAAILWGQSQPGSGELSGLSSFGGFFMAAWQHWPFPLWVVFISLWLLSCCSIHRWDRKGYAVGLFVAPVSAMAVLHALLSAIMLLFHGWAQHSNNKGDWLAYVWGPPLVLGALGLTIVMLIGMLGRQSGEGGREWWSRFGAWLGIYGFGWMVCNVAAVYGPLLGAFLLDSNTWTGATVSGWLGTTFAGLFAGKSASAGGESGKGGNSKLMEVIARIAPFVFILGLLVAVSTVLHLLIANLSEAKNHWCLLSRENHWCLLDQVDLKAAPYVLTACLLCVLLLAMRVDINEFSLNAFYRSRLVRCYLGATRFHEDERKPQNFTGFDEADDLKLAALADPHDPPTLVGPPSPQTLDAPLHIVNCALNLGGSSDLSLHTRHSAIFTLTPLHCGSRYLSRDVEEDKEMGYIPTKEFGGPDGQPSLGQAISVSGAAASPNMGYHSSPVVAFLLTLFNVRLGWWFPNPRQPGISSPSPWFSLRYLLMELFGAADDKSSYLAISDGGHFENLAPYELVKRRCRVIIISDGECDPNFQFEGLGTLIRMCEVDFKAKIEIDVRSIRPEGGSPWSRDRCAVGRIKYLDEPTHPGSLLIYLKASMAGHEDTAVLQYKAAHPSFPHEATSDQFYGEDQFESYRSLGHDIATRVFKPVLLEAKEIDKLKEEIANLEAKVKTDAGEIDKLKDAKAKLKKWNFPELAEKLEKICSPSLPNAGQFTHHAAQLAKLWSQLGSNPELASLDRELLDQELTASWPKEPSANFRSAFYLCSQMIQLMENVYLDVNLEETWKHPDNEGWRTLFTNWASRESTALRDTWALTHKTYGLRFQYFCERELDLPCSSLTCAEV